jgi:hypothetical protein
VGQQTYSAVDGDGAGVSIILLSAASRPSHNPMAALLTVMRGSVRGAVFGHKNKFLDRISASSSNSLNINSLNINNSNINIIHIHHYHMASTEWHVILPSTVI